MTLPQVAELGSGRTIRFKATSSPWPRKSQRSFLTEWEVMPGTYAWYELEDPEPGQEGNECPPRWPSEVLVTDR